LALTIIGNDDGAVLMDATTGYPLQGCRGFASAADAEAFLEWYAGIFGERQLAEDLRQLPAFEVADLRDEWDGVRDDEPSD
jgi:hypothetical protein